MGECVISQRMMMANGLTFDPASLPLTGWWRDYPPESGGAPVPWVSSASAGPSGGRTLYHGVSSPTQGALYNGHRAAGFNGTYESTNSSLADGGSGQTIGDFISSTAWTRWYVFKATTLNAPGDNPLNEPGFWASRALMDDVGYTYVCDTVDTSGIHFGQLDAGGRKVISAPITTGVLYRAIARFDGSFMRLRLNGVDATPVASGTMNTFAFGVPIRIGDSYSTAHFWGEVAEWGLMNTSLSDIQTSMVDAYLLARYGS